MNNGRIEALKACRDFLMDMHVMPDEWTVNESVKLLTKVEAALASNFPSIDTGVIIGAAEARAALYDGDDRQDIKTDVMNAFYAGVDFALESDAAKVAEEKAASDHPSDVEQGKTNG